MEIMRTFVPKSVRNKIFNCHNGYGYIVCKTGDKSISLYEFSQGKNNIFKTFGGQELPEFNKLFTIENDE